MSPLNPHDAGGPLNPQPETPARAADPRNAYIFADPSGRRWRRTRAVLLALATVLAVLASVLVVQQAQPTHRMSGTPLTLAQVGTNPPVVGDGPTVRILRIDSSGDVPVGVEPVSGTIVGALSEAEIEAAGDAEYVLQRFGYADDATHTISLTFDDGPHPVWTPQLLDLLSEHGVPATFFVTGTNAASYPEILVRTVDEGHSVAGHSVTHADLAEVSDLVAAFELRDTDREIRALTGIGTGFMRMPYIGADDQSLIDEIEGLIRVQNNGYLMTGQDFDPRDWYFADHPELGAMEMPVLDGRNLTVLLHDAGGTTRQPTLEYVEALIVAAKDAGYTFTTVPQAQPAVAAVNTPVEPTIADSVALLITQALYVWPSGAMTLLFWLAAISVPGLGLLYGVLALLGKRRRDREGALETRRVATSAVIAAYNEEMVIGRTIETLLGSRYPLTEIVIVDDGSSDSTSAIVSEWSERDSRVRLIRQPNAGKSAAMNNGMRQAVGEAVFTLDADTIVTPDTVGQLVRHMAGDESGKLAGVGMVIRVGNRSRNLLTRWQALEYVAQIGLERAAQDYLGAITIVPGACAIWRRDAILAAGGFSHDTLAEDCDLTLTLQRMGYRVTLDYEAQAHTEAPETVDALLAQRTRWTYGTIQALAKHRDVIFRPQYGWLGMFVLPWQLVQIVVPLLTIPLVWAAMYMMVATQGIGLLLAFFGFVTLIHLAMAAFSVAYLHERASLLAMVPIYRLIFDPLRAYLLYVSAFRALRGVKESWNKLQRTGSMDERALAEAAGEAEAAGPGSATTSAAV